MLINTLHILVNQILGLEKEDQLFFVILIPVTNIIEKTAIWIIHGFWKLHKLQIYIPHSMFHLNVKHLVKSFL